MVNQSKVNDSRFWQRWLNSGSVGTIDDIRISKPGKHLIHVEIEKVLELVGAYRPDFNCPASVYAHVSKPVKKDGEDVQYAMLAIFPQHGIMHLGEINAETRMFGNYDPNWKDLALYTKSSNHVVNQVSVPSKQFDKLKTLDDVLGIPGISVKRTLIPV